MEENKDITFGRILKVAFTRWKLLLVITLGVGIAGSLGIILGYNKLKGNYEVSFSYNAVDLGNEKYADGSDFYYKSLISYDNLSAIKNSKEDYSVIDIEKITNKNAISIVKIETKEDGKASSSNIYKIVLPVKYCSNNALVKDFLVDIANSALEKDKKIVEDSVFDSALKSYEETDTFEKQVSLLYTQAQNLKSSYNALSNEKGLSLAVIEDIRTNTNKIDLIMDDSFVTTMNYRISMNGYVKDYNSQEAKSFDYQAAVLGETKSQNEKKIEALNKEIDEIKAGAQISVLSEQIVSLLAQNIDINYQITAIGRKIANKEKTLNPELDPEFTKSYNAFKVDLDTYKEKLSDSVNDYRKVLNSAYIEGASVSFEKTSIISTTGTINTFLAIGISLVAGVIVGAIVNLIVDRKKLYE